jgi:hypothetical protein
MKVWKRGHRRSDPSNPDKLCILFLHFTIIDVVTFTICFSLQEKYKEEVVKKYGEGFNYEEEPIDDRAVYDSRGGKAHKR